MIANKSSVEATVPRLAIPGVKKRCSFFFLLNCDLEAYWWVSSNAKIQLLLLVFCSQTICSYEDDFLEGE